MPLLIYQTSVSWYGHWEWKPGWAGGVSARSSLRQIYSKQSDFLYTYQNRIQWHLLACKPDKNVLRLMICQTDTCSLTSKEGTQRNKGRLNAEGVPDFSGSERHSASETMTTMHSSQGQLHDSLQSTFGFGTKANFLYICLLLNYFFLLCLTAVSFFLLFHLSFMRKMLTYLEFE